MGFFFLYFVELLQFNRKGRSLDLSVIFLRSGTPTKVTYDVQKTMILLILGTISVCNFFFTNVHKFLVYRNINLIYIYIYFFFFFFFFSNTIVASVNVYFVYYGKTNVSQMDSMSSALVNLAQTDRPASI